MPDLDALQTRERDDLSRRGILQLDALEPLEPVKLRHPRLLGGLIGVERQQRHDVTDVHRSTLDSSDAEPAEIGRMIDRRDEHLQRARRVVRRRRHVPDDCLEQRR